MALIKPNVNFNPLKIFTQPPEKTIKEQGAAPTGVGGVIGSGTKIAVKGLPFIAGAVGGFLGAKLLGGGSSHQEQQQDSTQQADQTTKPTQINIPDFTLSPTQYDYKIDRSRTTTSTKYIISNSPYAGISGSTTVSPYDYMGGAGQSTSAGYSPYQGTSAGIGQETEQGQTAMNLDSTGILLLVGAAVAGYVLSKR